MTCEDGIHGAREKRSVSTGTLGTEIKPTPVATPGAKCTAPTTMLNVAAVNFASRVIGVRQKIQAIMHAN